MSCLEADWLAECHGIAADLEEVLLAATRWLFWPPSREQDLCREVSRGS